MRGARRIRRTLCEPSVSYKGAIHLERDCAPSLQVQVFAALHFE